jgi:metal-responsive CopG/Arc/MetJ family transcriptional regulator
MGARARVQPQSVVRTTLTLPADLLAAADRVVAAGMAASRNALVAEAIRRELAVRRRAEIDAAFADMGSDTLLQREAAQLNAEFALSDWQAFQQAEP